MAKEGRFQLGDIVKLKSGGPEMTVDYVFGDGDYRCQWFAGKKLESGRFPEQSLLPASATQPIPPSGAGGAGT